MSSDEKVELWGVSDLRVGEVVVMSYPGFPVLGHISVVPVYMTSFDPKTGAVAELKFSLTVDQAKGLAVGIAEVLREQGSGPEGSSSVQ